MTPRAPYIERGERANRIWIIDPRGHHAPGFYRARLVKGGPFVPARLWIEDGDRCPETGELLSDVIYHLEVDGAELRPIPKGYTLQGERITEREYRYLLAMSRHAVEHEPSLPQANPTAPVDLMRAPAPF